MNKFHKRKKATSISNFDSHTNLPHYKLLMVLNRLRDNYFDGGEKNSYGTRCVKSIKDNVICLSKYQVKDAVAYLFLIVISQLALSLPTRLLVFVWGLISCQDFSVLFYYQSKWISKLKNNHLIKTRKLCNILYTDDLSSTVMVENLKVII